MYMQTFERQTKRIMVFLIIVAYVRFRPDVVSCTLRNSLPKTAWKMGDKHSHLFYSKYIVQLQHY